MSSALPTALAGRTVRLGRVRLMAITRCAPLSILLLSLGSPAIAGATNGSGPLQPTPLGHGMCQAQRFADGSVEAQIAVDNVTCTTATTVLGPAAERADGAQYTANSFTCKSTVEGAGSPWAAAWRGTYYAYACANGHAQAAFNWGMRYIYGSSGGSTGSTGIGTLTFTNMGHRLLPSALGQGMCQARAFADGSVQAQIAVYQTTCAVATSILGPAADHAHGGPYARSGYVCKATVEGAGSPWAGAWGGIYYAYTCADGGAQAAFNWGRGYTY